MSKRNMFTVIITVFILGILFQGTYAHEGFGPEDNYLVTGFAQVLLYKDIHEHFAVSSSCMAQANDPPDIQERPLSSKPSPPMADPPELETAEVYITGSYVIIARVGNQWYAHRSRTNDDDSFVGDLYDYVGDETENGVATATGLWGYAHGVGEAVVYKKKIINGVVRLWALGHQHGLPSNEWRDDAGERLK